jgi:hypothetical protein
LSLSQRHVALISSLFTWKYSGYNGVWGSCIADPTLQSSPEILSLFYTTQQRWPPFPTHYDLNGSSEYSNSPPAGGNPPSPTSRTKCALGKSRPSSMISHLSPVTASTSPCPISCLLQNHQQYFRHRHTIHRHYRFHTISSTMNPRSGVGIC